MLNRKIKGKITQNSISLKRYGLNDLAWSKEEAQTLINSIMNDKIGILGGDVYKLISGQLKPLYDNWSCESSPTESEEDYYHRSKREALKFIKTYPISTKETLIFSITFTERI